LVTDELICLLPSLRGAKPTKQSRAALIATGLLRGACHRARLAPTRWLRNDDNWIIDGSLSPTAARFAVLMTWKTLALMMVGLVLGISVGVLPGLGGPNGVAILLPLTFTMDPTSAIVMLSCIYWGALSGGAITSILFNIPGEAWSVGDHLRRLSMAQQGQRPRR